MPLDKLPTGKYTIQMRNRKSMFTATKLTPENWISVCQTPNIMVVDKREKQENGFNCIGMLMHKPSGYFEIIFGDGRTYGEMSIVRHIERWGHIFEFFYIEITQPEPCTPENGSLSLLILRALFG
jgi:hypothetical protein